MDRRSIMKLAFGAAAAVAGGSMLLPAEAQAAMPRPAPLPLDPATAPGAAVATEADLAGNAVHNAQYYVVRRRYVYRPRRVVVVRRPVYVRPRRVVVVRRPVYVRRRRVIYY